MKRYSHAVLAMLVATAAMTAPAHAGLRVPQIVFPATALASNLGAQGESINVLTQQQEGLVWGSTVSTNSTMTIQFELPGNPHGNEMGIAKLDATGKIPLGLVPVFPASAGPGWFAVASFRTGGGVVVNLFDASANLIANAPHMPVHLGSMSESIKTVIARNPDMQAGDVVVLNDPYHGGTHLPDVTVVTPVYLDDADARPSFYVASRGHHADIGGITPGSMPPFSKTIADEGVLFDNFLLVRGGQMREPALREQLQSGDHPSRNPDQNIADLRAQVAANEKGVQELRAMVTQFGRETVAAYMLHVQDNAEESVRRVITALHDGSFELELDNGARIVVKVTVDAAQRAATIDFTGTSAQLPNNFNAPKAVTVAAVLYVFRLLVDDDIPLNAGCLKPLQIVVPEGCMLNPNPPAAVVAGNVETSQSVTNALLGALGVMASSPCTMSNFTFGNDTYQYYETISGGSGAGALFDASGRVVGGFPGTSVVQTHMTNSRLTDPEVLEFRFPVRLESYALRAGSGGAGRWRGGDGGVRRIRFLEHMTASVLSNGRRIAPFGMAGGSPGALGINRVERADGRIEPLTHIGSAEMAPGDCFVIETTGGGGYGVPE